LRWGDSLHAVTARRRYRQWLAALLLAASPAAGGQLVALLHPCPVAAGPRPVAVTAHQEHDHSATPAGPTHDHDEEQDCTCVGSCNAPALTAVPPVHIATVDRLTPTGRPTWNIVEALDPVAAAIDRLPPKTAPPLA